MRSMRPDLPSGTVTFVFTDVEGSTRLLHELGAEAYAAALATHRRIVRKACGARGGVEVDTQGDAFFIAFPTATGALEAAQEVQARLAAGPIHLRIGIHTGTALLSDEGYVGADVHRGARIGAAGHGGQVLLSKESRGQAQVEVTDLGEHRLKDIERPVWIFQLGHDRFPPLRTISNTNLPRPASSFVGRDREVRDVVALLRDGARLLTLTGPGGSGKTRLAIEAAAELVAAFRNGVFWVPLAPLRDPALVIETVAQTLGATVALAEHIADRELLLLVDNLEQVIAASPALASLVEACPNLRVVSTSRELLRVKGEVEYRVPPLDDPEAVELFCARAGVEPDETVRELCRALDNLPLALELAAARTSILSPRQIMERLSTRLDLLKGGRDADPRQATLRATIEWSYELLDSAEQRLFVRLAIFRGGCTIEAAKAIAGADLDTLQSLVDKSLLRHIDVRFRMLETVREYAAERLGASGETIDVRQLHADHFIAFAEEAYSHLKADPKVWLDGLEADHDNLRAVLDRLEAAGDTQRALQLAGALYRYWYMRGHMTEGWRVLDRLLRADDRPTPARARALLGATVGATATNPSDLATARPRAEEALALNRALGDAWGAAYAVFMLGMIATEESDWTAARPLFEESLAAFRELDDEHYILLSSDGLAWIHRELGDRERSRTLHEEVLRLAREQSDGVVAAVQLFQLATLAFEDGRTGDAFAMLKESLRINRDHDIPAGIVEDLCIFASFLAAEGRAELAARLLSRAQILRDEIGGVSAWVGEMNAGTLASLRVQLDEAARAELDGEGRRLTVDEAIALALDS